MAESQPRDVASPEDVEGWAAYFERRAADGGPLHIGNDERRLLAKVLRGSLAPSEKQARVDMYRDFCLRLNIARVAMNDAEIRKVLDEIDGHFHSAQGGH